MERDP
jgi:hypothetical protein